MSKDFRTIFAEGRRDLTEKLTLLRDQLIEQGFDIPEDALNILIQSTEQSVQWKGFKELQGLEFVLRKYVQPVSTSSPTNLLDLQRDIAAYFNQMVYEAACYDIKTALKNIELPKDKMMARIETARTNKLI